jgi:erythronate-4-phosphate dehydrogenase
MKPTSWLINSSRGEVCNTTDLKDAHVNGILKNLILDVWENEPDIDLELLRKCFIGTPHIAGYSVDGKANGTSTVVNACSRFFGFDLQNWYPANLPLPKNCIVDLSSAKLSHNEIIRNAILASFDVRADDHRLRTTPSSFEKLRGDYPPRREFPAYTIKLDGSRKKLSKILKEIGFNVITSNMN